MALKALILGQVDFRRGLLEVKHIEQIHEAIRELIADTADYEDATAGPAARKEKVGGAPPEEESDEPPPPPDLPVLQDLPPEWRGNPVLCVAGRGPFDGAVAMMLAQLLEKHGLGCRLEADAAVSSSNVVRLNSIGVNMVCFSYLDLGSSPAHLRHSIRRIRRQIPGAALVAGLWGHEEDETREQLRATAGTDHYVSSLREVLSLCIDVASGSWGKSAATRDAKSGPSAA